MVAFGLFFGVPFFFGLMADMHRIFKAPALIISVISPIAGTVASVVALRKGKDQIGLVGIILAGLPLIAAVFFVAGLLLFLVFFGFWASSSTGGM